MAGYNRNRTKYEIVEDIVRSGNSRIFKNWNEFAGVTMEDFLEGLRWLYNAEFPSGYDEDMHKRLRYELGCTKDGKLVHLFRSQGDITAFYHLDTGKIWCGNVSISARDRI